MNKKELINRLLSTRNETIDVLDSLDDEEFEATLPDSDWRVQDMLFHITMWEAELVKLLFQIQRGQKPTTVHYGQKPIDEANHEWFSLGKGRDLESIYDDFIGVREQTIRRLGQFSDEDLQRTVQFPFGEQTLEERIAQDSYAHEELHMEQIKEMFEL